MFHCIRHFHWTMPKKFIFRQKDSIIQGTFFIFMPDNLECFQIIGQKIKKIARYYYRNLMGILNIVGHYPGIGRWHF